MSRKKTTTIKVKVPTKHELLMQEVMRACPGLDAVPSHAALAALARDAGSTGPLRPGARGKPIDVPTELAQFEVRRAAVSADPSVAIVARAADPGAWSKANRLYEESREVLGASPDRAASLAERGDRALRTALESGARALASEERTLVTSVMNDALRSIGCRTTIADGDGSSGIWAERGHQVVAVLIENGGRVELDVAGFEGSGCVPFHEEIEKAVIARGGTLEDVEVVQHGDAGGGVLIRSAARAAGPRGDMARAIAGPPAPRGRFSRAPNQRSSGERVNTRGGA
jgi:hypothetical protein